MKDQIIMNSEAREAYMAGYNAGRETIMKELVKLHEKSIKPAPVFFPLCTSCSKRMA